MSVKRIIAVGLELASDNVEYVDFRSKTSLLDWDIVLFRPEIRSFYYHTDQYQGKPSLDDASSFRLKECCAHWRNEIKQAVDTGKTVIVFLAPLEEVFIDTGQRTYSGTGRNQRTTRLVEVYSNYQAIPAGVSPIASTGRSMKLVSQGADILASYWAEFESVSQYEVLLTGDKVRACLVTRAGDKTTGALYRSNLSAGTLLLLPDIDFSPDEFYEADGEAWSADAKQFAARMIASVVALDKALRATSAVTPEPSWATAQKYILGSERALRAQLLEEEKKVEEAQKRKEQVADQLTAAGTFRALLYEKGKPLENAIIEALRLMGFTAAPFKDSDSEFDVVFESTEGRLIGEAEGKDNKPVNIDKLRQLAMNIHEDLQRESVSVPAKPVLFGNGFRLQPLGEREDPFTEKCYNAAATSSTAIVFTPDLFPVVQYLVSQPDTDYMLACRQALLSSIGRVAFPAPPTQSLAEATQVDESDRG